MKGEGWLTFLLALILIGAVARTTGGSGTTSEPPASVVQTVSGH